MKKIFWFSIISGATLVVLIIAFVMSLAIILSARVENTAPDISSATASTAQPAPKDISREILLIFDGDDCFISQLNVTNDGELQFSTNVESFNSILCLDGKGKIDFNGEKFEISKGDSYFIPANLGMYSVSGNLEIIVSKIN